MFSSNNKQKYNNIESSLDLSQHKFNLYQQFFIIGIDSKLMFKSDKIDLKAIPEICLSPKVISKFPPNNLPYLNIPDNIIASHCFPNGIRDLIIDYNQSNYETKINYQNNFVFSLENQNVEDKSCSLRANRLYFSCLLFYENINNYHDCILDKKMKPNIHKKIIKDFEEIKNKGTLLPKVICLSSFRPYFEQSKEILELLKKYVDNYMYNKITKDNFNIYPIEKIIEGLIYELPALPRSNYVLKLSKDAFKTNCNDNKNENKSVSYELDKKNKKDIYVNNNNNDNDNDNNIIFYETAFNKQPRNIMNYSILTKYFRIKEIFEIIKHILLEEPILFFCEDVHVLTYIIEGFISLLYPFEYQYPVVSVLPEENYSFVSLFKHFIFGINYKYADEVILKKGISLDDKKFIRIIKIEKRFENIININEEDKVQYPVITAILSDTSKPVIKIEQDKMGDLENINDNIDNEILSEKKKIILPAHYYEKCQKRLEKNTAEKLKELVNKSKNKKNIPIEEKENIFNSEIRKTFIYFFSCIFQRYQGFCKTYEKLVKSVGMSDSINSNSYSNNYSTSNSKVDSFIKDEREDSFLSKRTNLEEKIVLNKLKITDIFCSKQFLEDKETPQLDRPFFKKFLDTQMFFHFIKKKMFPNSTQDKLDILYFDYKVNEKLSRGSRKIKIDTKFFTTEQESLKEEIKISSLKREPSEKMFKYFCSNRNHSKNAINYFQKIINNNKIIEKEDKNNISIDNDNSINDSISVNNDNNDNNDNSESENGFCIISLHQAYEEVGSNFSVTNKKLEEIEEESNKKIIFSYYVFPKLLNDNIFYKENIFNEGLENNVNNANNFNIKNCNCLYNQFEKEANDFINNPIIEQNYKIYGYNINSKWEKRYEYEECINTLWLLYLSKTFEKISHSKKRYYFEEILMFLNDKNNKVDQDIILVLFNAINKYGDRNMNQELFMFLDTKKYINFLCLREKTKLENNYVKYINSAMSNTNHFSEKNRGSIGDGSDNKVYRYDLDYFFNKENVHNNKNKKLFDFYLYSYCLSSNLDENKDVESKSKDDTLSLEDKDKTLNEEGDSINGNNICGEPLLINIKDLFQNDTNKKYIEVECHKCKKTKKVTISCFLTDDYENNYQLNFNLLSPLALKNEPYFKNNNNLNLSYISSEHTEEYLSAIFYFYEQGLPCNFLIPKGKQNKIIRQERATTYNNIDPIEDLYSSYICHKKSYSLLQTPRLTRREINNMGERLNIFDFKKVGQKGGPLPKSPSPKKGSIMKRSSKFAQKLRSAELDIKPKVTFSCFKK